MDYFAIRIAILLWLVRPQDWMSGFGGFQFMQYAMLLAIIGVWRRPEGFTFKMLFHSPADWLALSYLGWIVYTTGDWIGTARALLPFAAFYYCTALTLDSVPRLKGFLNYWVAGLGIVGIFALSTNFGFDLAPGSSDLTSSFGGRLALNTWIFNNPNGLGHGLVALIPLAYVWLIWKRPGGLKLLGFALIAISAYAVFLTQSKGAYLCGAAALTVVWLFRKPKFLQLTILVVVLTAGVAAIKLLPRMETLSDKEDGIAGRLMIWQMAYNAMANTKTGEGWKKFEAWVQSEEYGLFKKATHGSYANIGADLGYAGLFLFVGIMYAGARTIYQTQLDPDESEESAESVRCQRALLSLLSSFATSAWILDRAYHTDYFILAGAIAAFHRLMSQQVVSEGEAQPAPAADSPQSSLALAWGPQPALAAPLAPSPLIAFDRQPALDVSAGLLPNVTRPMVAFERQPGLDLTPAFPGSPAHVVASDASPEDASLRPPLVWPRLTLMDFILMTAALFAVIFLWERMMTNFISL